MADLTQAEWTRRLKGDTNAVILDVRTQQEVEDGYIPGALNIDIFGGQAFLDAIDALDKSKTYYVYCRSGNRSGQACALMSTRGFDNCLNLMGGMMEWEGEVAE